MNTNRLKWFGFGFLVFIIMVLGWEIIPAHWTSIWMDREFTDWVSPIANRLQGPTRLYADGLHSPMPPLPAVLVHLLFPRGAIWLEESGLNFLFQAATLLLLYWAISRQVKVSLIFVSTLATAAFFFALPKTILYDSMAQFLVACAAVVAVRLVGAFRVPANSRSFRHCWWLQACLGGFLALLMLTKQSTGAGAVLGVCSALMISTPELNFGQRCKNVLFVVIFMAVIICLATLMLSPFIDPAGMVKDVFLTGTEPKGGGERCLVLLLKFAGKLLWLPALISLLLLAFSRWRKRSIPWRNYLSSLSADFTTQTKEDNITSSGQILPMFTAAFATIAGLAVVYFFHNSTLQLIGYVSGQLLNFTLAICLIQTTATILAARLEQNNGWDHYPLTPYVLVFLPAALFHNLSANVLRWHFDNNPLIVLAALTIPLLIFGRHAKRLWGGKWSVMISNGLLFACIFATWCNMSDQLAAVEKCTQEWPDVRHLAGAKLRPEADGMHKLVLAVQSLANPQHGDEVLLLPNDPNVEAWFDRARPALSSAIIFPDQYLDRYVEKDFLELQRQPPMVIVLGPRNYWRAFSQQWNVNYGSERLVDLVLNKLLPAKYDLRLNQPIEFRGGSDFMEVYVRRS